MSNIKKARYTGAPKLLNQKLSVIKVTGTSKNIKQINYFLPKGYGLIKKIKPVYPDEPLFLYREIEEAGVKGTIVVGFFSGFPVIFITPMSLCTHSKVLAIL
jgi:hypothetical protein